MGRPLHNWVILFFALLLCTFRLFANQVPTAVDITLSGNITKVYDGNRVAYIPLQNIAVTGIANNDDVSISVTARYLTPNAIEQNIEIQLITISGADKDKYTIGIVNNHLTGNIIPKHVNFVTTPYPIVKSYDGTIAGPNLSGRFDILGIIGMDDVSANATSTFSSKNVGFHELTINNFVLTGSHAANYTPDVTPIFTTAQITPIVLNIQSEIDALYKTYDGTDTIHILNNVFTVDNYIEGDDVGISAVGVFDDHHAGTQKSVSITDLVLIGSDNINYHIDPFYISTAGTIFPKALHFEIKENATFSKQYDGTTSLLFISDQVEVTGLILHDNVTPVIEGIFDTKNVGEEKAIQFRLTGLEGENADDYIISEEEVTAVGNITPASLHIQPNIHSQVSKYYDGTTNVVLQNSNFVITGLVSGDTISFSATGSYDDKYAGLHKHITVSEINIAGLDENNYLLQHNITQFFGDIIPKKLTLKSKEGTPVQKNYDGTNRITLSNNQFELDGQLTGDDVNVHFMLNTTLDNKDAGVGKIVYLSDIYLSGLNAADYSIQGAMALPVATVFPKTIALTIQNQAKVYGQPDPQVDYTTSGLIGDDQVTDLIEREAGDQVGRYSYRYMNNLPANYILEINNDAYLDISPATLRIKADDKVHKHGTEIPALTMSFSGFVNNETASIFDIKPEAYISDDASGVGLYEIKVTQIVSPNYDIHYQSGILSVEPNDDNLTHHLKAWVIASGLHVQLYVSVPQKANISLYSSQGVLTLTHSAQLSKGLTSFSIPTNHVKSGNYFLVIQGQRFSTTRQIFIP